jgi:hypothetical protein
MQVEDFIQRQEIKGKRILKTLILLNMLFFVLVLLLSLLNGIFNNFIGLIIMIVLCMLIYYGGNIAKWIYIVINILNTFSLIYTLTVGEIVSRATILVILLNATTIMLFVLTIVTSAVLIFSSSVKEFMYKQRDSY